MIETILDTMVRAPSAGNEQNRNFYVLDDQAKLVALEDQVKAHYQKLLANYKNPILMKLMALILAEKPDKLPVKFKHLPPRQTSPWLNPP